MSTWSAIATRALRTRWLVRSPIWLYRHHLGALMGRRFVLLEHIGRRTGTPRLVVLEVIESPDPSTVRVVSGLGPSSQWFRNIQAHPQVRVTTGRLVDRPASARVLPPDQARSVMDRYATRHPVARRALSAVLTHGDADGLAGDLSTLPIVDLTAAHPG